ncbi:response regulator [Solilutibacter silvestris]|uniref:Response regulator receiver domain-containing protein n=1 Tax=Solilutibacter silvestris TaxID=1645665 RepID=A0A2K1PY85_9GAMM|nr:response regulator [Lysobacter silvestris]PNS07756.1 Response regulator receiver domain-containing protein [Lysobacter silvestris]
MDPVRAILLAEDTDADAEMTIGALQEAHIANPVIHVRDGVEALDYLHRSGRFDHRAAGDPALVLLDINMPRMDGLEVLQSLRAEDGFRNLPIVILSSSQEEVELARHRGLGANAYVVKPHDLDRYFDTVATIGKLWGTLDRTSDN